MADEKRLTPELCLARAAECRSLSRVVDRPAQQAALMDMEATWARLARESMPQESQQ
jgi:hypothetical protein